MRPLSLLLLIFVCILHALTLHLKGALLQTEQTQIRQLLYELPDQGILCLLMEI